MLDAIKDWFTHFDLMQIFTYAVILFFLVVIAFKKVFGIGKHKGGE